MNDADEQTEFKFSELDQAAKDKAIQKYAAPEHNWWESVYDQYKTDPEIKALGFDIDEISFSGFYSQGDGACWIGRVDLEKFVRHHYTSADDAVKCEILCAVFRNGDAGPYLDIRTQGHYSHSHSHTMYVQYCCETYYAGDTVIAPDASDIFAGAFTDTLMEAIGYEKALEELEKRVIDSARELADRIYADLENDYESYFEEEFFADHCDMNDYRFDENGNLI